MGRIKTSQIKSATFKILNKHRDKIKDNFEDNKIVLKDLAKIESKKLRNVVAGYLTRLIKQEKLEK
ncbi:30S ribosomal protein S17e [Candidatus Woesearchaeota archaeon]|nr:30S ribosomal protein S17e [Candidatus Woesearchaeota archaeon]